MSISKINELVSSIERDFKELKKELKKIKKDKPEKKAIKKNGLNKKYKLSNELCEFLNINSSIELTRLEVNSKILGYIKDNNLGEKRDIKIDNKLRKIIDCDRITYFTLQKHMNKHYLYS